MRTLNTVAYIAAAKTVLPSFVLVLAVVLVGSPAYAEKQPEDCKFQGSWFGFSADGSASWMSTAHGQSSSIGTYIVEYPGFDFGWFWPTAAKGSTLRGAWERIDEDTFAFTVIGLALDLAGTTVGIVKLSGTDSLLEDCNTMLIENTVEVFGGSQDPFEEDPDGGVIQLPPHYGYRMKVDPPYPF